MQGMEQRRKRGLLPLLSWPKILICVKQMWNIYNLHTYLWTLFLWQLKECFSSASQYFQFQAIASVTPSFEMFSITTLHLTSYYPLCTPVFIAAKIQLNIIVENLSNTKMKTSDTTFQYKHGQGKGQGIWHHGGQSDLQDIYSNPSTNLLVNC